MARKSGHLTPLRNSRQSRLNGSVAEHDEQLTKDFQNGMKSMTESAIRRRATRKGLRVVSLGKNDRKDRGLLCYMLLNRRNRMVRYNCNLMELAEAVDNSEKEMSPKEISVAVTLIPKKAAEDMIRRHQRKVRAAFRRQN
jgi:hypothetical protein